jgi:tRNA A-37 threonylcarbamoyl transferase component Bud32
LQARAFRSVSLETQGGEARIVKRFHHPTPWLALFDGLRARRERRAHEELSALGLPVPRVLGLERAGSTWELALACVPNARGLDELLAGRAPPVAWNALLVELARLLARVQNAGFAHGDLHPGNVLLDERGAPWLIDLQRVRRETPEPSRCLSELVECAAFAREHLGPVARQRFLVAWLQALAPALRPRLQGSELLLAIERRARRRRAERVRAGLGRWLRESSRVTWADGGWERRWRMGAAAEREGWLVLRGAARELRAHWLGAARLFEHGIPCAIPARLELARGRAVFEIQRRRGASEVELRALLAERGLALGDSPVAGYFPPPREPEDFALTV